MVLLWGGGVVGVVVLLAPGAVAGLLGDTAKGADDPATELVKTEDSATKALPQNCGAEPGTDVASRTLYATLTHHNHVRLEPPLNSGDLIRVNGLVVQCCGVVRDRGSHWFLVYRGSRGLRQHKLSDPWERVSATDPDRPPVPPTPAAQCHDDCVSYLTVLRCARGSFARSLSPSLCRSAGRIASEPKRLTSLRLRDADCSLNPNPRARTFLPRLWQSL
jgi:hypothetical protein